MGQRATTYKLPRQSERDQGGRAKGGGTAGDLLLQEGRRQRPVHPATDWVSTGGLSGVLGSSPVVRIATPRMPCIWEQTVCFECGNQEEPRTVEPRAVNLFFSEPFSFVSSFLSCLQSFFSTHCRLQ